MAKPQNKKSSPQKSEPDKEQSESDKEQSEPEQEPEPEIKASARSEKATDEERAEIKASNDRQPDPKEGKRLNDGEDNSAIKSNLKVVDRTEGEERPKRPTREVEVDRSDDEGGRSNLKLVERQFADEDDEDGQEND